MSRAERPLDMAAMPVQHPAAPASAAEARGRFFNSGNAFNVKLPAVPARVFGAEARRALAGAPTGFIDCDQSEAIGCPFPATTPLMLARYAVVEPQATLTADFKASGTIWTVLRGSGTATIAAESLPLGRGDVLLAPGGVPCSFAGGFEGLVLWGVTNEPQLAFEGLRPAAAEATPFEPVHYSAVEIERQLDRVVGASQNATTSGMALIFSSERHEPSRNIMPSLTLSLNTVPPGSHQRSHRHNAAAITLVLQGEDCYSTIAGERCPWEPGATLVTPPGAPHSHHNDGGARALFLIVQDGGLHYHARTMDFTFLEDATG